MNTFNEYIFEAGATTAEPLHWAIDPHVDRCILLKRGRKSILGIDFDGKNYTVMTDPKDKSSLGCQKSKFVDAFAMAQELLNDKLEGALIPACPSNIRRWLKRGPEKSEDDGIEMSNESVSESSDEWETATSSIPKDYFEWIKGKNEGEVVLRRRRKNYIKVCKRIPDPANSKFFKEWIKEKPYCMKMYAYSMENKSHLKLEYATLEELLKCAESYKKMDYSANALNFPAMPDDVKEWLEKGYKNPSSEVVSEAAEHVFRWEIFKKYANKVSLILDGRYEVASIYRNFGKSADVLPYAIEIYSFNHACEFAGLEKTIADAVARVAKELIHPIKLKGDPQMAGVSAADVKVPPMPTSARLWLDKSFDEATILSEKK